MDVDDPLRTAESREALGRTLDALIGGVVKLTVMDISSLYPIHDRAVERDR